MNLATLWTGLFWAWIVLELWVAVGRRAQKTEATLKDRGTQLQLWLTIALSLTASSFLLHYALAPMHVPDLWLKPAALALLALGLAVRIAAIATLGRSFTANVATRSGQQLHRSGLYSVVRHPSYLGMEIIFLAIGLHTNDWLCLILALVPTTAAVLHRIRIEEEALRGIFGDEYDQYCRTTKRLVPGIF